MRKAKPLWISGVRPLQREDMESIGPAKQRHQVNPARIRDSHHRIARLAASGLRNGDIAARTGYTYCRVSQILQSPAMQDLVTKYRERVTEAWVQDIGDDYNMARESWRLAQRLRLDALESAMDGEREIPLRELNAIAFDGEDRFGTTKKSTNINLNADFAAELEKALSRSNSAEAKVIQVEATPDGIRRRI